MSLTAGASLQDKYAVQKQLHQSDFGVTYQAQHSILGRPVVLQTLNAALRQRDDFAQLRQQFLSRVRAISQQPLEHLHVLDYFEEDGLPYVVFELVPGQPLPQFSDWIPVAPAAQVTDLKATDLNATDLSLTDPNPQALQALSATDELLGHPAAARHLTAAELARLAATHSAYAETPAVTALDAVAPDAVTAPTTGSVGHLSAESLPSVTPTSSKTLPAKWTYPTHSTSAGRAWMPMALIFISILGGLVGVGLGFSWRFSSARVQSSKSAQSSSQSQNAAPRLFSREQSFPSEADWPISEIPQLFTPALPEPLLDPIPRSSTEEYLPPYRPLPAEPSLPAPEPSVEPPLQSTDPSPEAPVSPEPQLPQQQPAIQAAPPVQVAPPVAAPPEPLPPAAPEPPPPALEVPPLRQPKVFQN
ncbi:MAG: hypothetical protein KME07_13275 [Pegethrix bostrychoides GSE-TBD4-15B]|jgi:hypothetical protein|uniref:Serine/threonine protein kinase n=1 Tax=Pegethrix bostrychoides GSE-TBD4-15B TaxID=2839662 RepID=A0A951PDH9_9CYAN|nr:hypothetical protein [Pegethrix bostrychoides GSE-TBD4-15B]